MDRIDVRAIAPHWAGHLAGDLDVGQRNFLLNVGWPACGEIDIMELVGNQPNVVHGTVHYGNDWSQHQYTGGSTYLPFGEPFADEFHVFSIEWDETGIRWLLDDQQYFQVNLRRDRCAELPVQQRLSSSSSTLRWAASGRATLDDTTEFPNFMAVDYVRVYQ